MFRSSYLTLAVAGVALLLQLVVQSCASGDDGPTGGVGGLAPTTCGNGVIDRDVGEQCDGLELGGATCASLNYGNGQLGCTVDCTYDDSMCDGTQPPPGGYGG